MPYSPHSSALRTSRRFRLFILLCVVACVALLLPPERLAAQEGAAPESLRVVIKPLTPFVAKTSDGEYIGFSIDLWKEIAQRAQLPYTFQWVNTVTEQLDAVRNGEADVAITGISITRQREETLDFSLPYFKSGLQVMTAVEQASGWSSPLTTLLALLFSRSVYNMVGELVIAIVIVGHLFWLLERRGNPDFPRAWLPGVWEGIWYAVVTLVTVGYGDRTARSVAGRLVAIVWMFTSLLIVANFTANLTSQLTVDHFQGTIDGLSDLPGKQVATVEGSTAAGFLEDQGIAFTPTRSIDEAYTLLQDATVEAIVYDLPVLLYHAAGEGQGQVELVGAIFQPQDYGIAFAPDSHLREPVNRALLNLIEDGTYEEIYSRWFGSDE